MKTLAEIVKEFEETPEADPALSRIDDPATARFYAAEIEPWNPQGDSSSKKQAPKLGGSV